MFYKNPTSILLGLSSSARISFPSSSKALLKVNSNWICIQIHLKKNSYGLTLFRMCSNRISPFALADTVSKSLAKKSIRKGATVITALFGPDVKTISDSDFDVTLMLLKYHDYFYCKIYSTFDCYTCRAMAVSATHLQRDIVALTVSSRQ